MIPKGRCLWSEDECTRHDPSAERLPDAWLRLFGETYTRSTLLDEQDLGDTLIRKFPRGRYEVASYEGVEIWHRLEPL